MKKRNKIDTTLFEQPEIACFILDYITETFESFRNDKKTLKMVYDFCFLAIEFGNDEIIKHSIEIFCLLLRSPISAKMKVCICNKLKELMNEKDLTLNTRERVLYGYLLSFSALSQSQKEEWYSFLSDGRRFKYIKIFQYRPLYYDRMNFYRERLEFIRLANKGERFWKKC